MSSTATIPPPAASRRDRYKLQVNSYDRVASLLVSLLIMVGVTVAALLIIYFAGRLLDRTKSQVVTPVPSPSSDAALGLAEDPEPPGLEDAPDLLDPQLQDTLNTLTESVNASAALLSDEVIDNANQVGKGSGLGDRRAGGTGGDGDGGDAPGRHVKFKPTSQAEYAACLDALNIEMGVVSKRENKIYYASNFTKPKPDTRVGDPPDNRFRTSNYDSVLYNLDRQLAIKAGIDRPDGFIFLFYPNETFQMLARAEQQKAGNRTLDQIKMTVFRLQREGNEFKFTVESQDYY
jgi:hypothetical protein